MYTDATTDEVYWYAAAQQRGGRLLDRLATMVLAGLVTTTISQSGLLDNLVQTKTKTKTKTDAKTKTNNISIEY